MLVLDVTPRFELSPYLFMQFMEPLGTTDGSVEAGWDFTRNEWRPKLIEVVRELAPTMIRWGGIYTSYWKWREGVGHAAKGYQPRTTSGVGSKATRLASARSWIFVPG